MLSQRERGPGVAVVVPAYQSERTISECLRCLIAQTYDKYEIIVVDSSPDNSTSKLISPFANEVGLIRSQERLLPHDARNLGARNSRSELIAFTDPDIYVPPDWLHVMVGGFLKHGDVIVGSIACHNPGWAQHGMHLAKFDSWLPGGHVRGIEISMTGNMLLPRAVFEKVGGFDGKRMLADTLMSWCLEKHGYRKTFLPDAVVRHDHDGAIDRYWRERKERGWEFARLRAAWNGWPASRTLVHFLITAIPIRLVGLLSRGLRNARRAGLAADFFRTVPVSLLGHTAWLAGEAVGYASHLLGRGDGRGLECGS